MNKITIIINDKSSNCKINITWNIIFRGEPVRLFRANPIYFFKYRPISAAK